MKFISLLLFLAVAATAQPEAERTVVVCVHRCAPALRAESVASRIFEEIGVRLDWRHEPRACPEGAVRIRVTNNTARDLLPGALAYAQPYAGSQIEVFHDRVVSMAPAQRQVLRGLLGHVYAHEIAHVLQGVSRHSEDGVMRANWRARDILDMSWRPLSFSELDARLIQVGIDKRIATPRS